MLENQIYEQLSNLKSKTPLVEAITNYVTINDCANILLSIGASPAMCESADEAYDFTKLANAVYLNIGTLTKEQELAMLQAVKAADELNIPEIKSLAGVETKVRGVDSLDMGEDGVEVCKQLAKDWKCIVAASGKIDIITDGEITALVHNGDDMLTKVTGSGCMLGALTAGFCGANTDNLLASCIASFLSMGIAGEHAAQHNRGCYPGSFRVFLIDEIYKLTDTILRDKSKIEFV